MKKKTNKTDKISLTFSLTLLEGDRAATLGHQVSSAREAESASHLRLVRPQRAGQAGDKAVVRVVTR